MSGIPDDMPRQYLLRRLSDADAEQFEERLLSDDECAERVREAEDDLLDDYAAGRLTADDRAAVEQYLLSSPDGEQRLQFARALAATANQAAQATAPTVPSGSGGAPAAPGSRRWIAPLGLLIAAGAAYFLLMLPGWRTPPPAGSPSADGTPVAPGAPEPQIAARPADTTPPHAVLLLAEVQRGGSAATQISIPQGTTRLRLQLEVTSSAGTASGPQTYQVAVRDQNNQELLAAASLTAREVGVYHIVEVEAPVTTLGEGVRHIVLSRAEGDRLEPVFDWEIDLRHASATP